MRAKHINPFIIGTQEIFKEEMNVAAERTELSLQEKDLTTQDITIIISVTGDIEGVVIFGMSGKTADSFISAELQEPAAGLDLTVKISGMAELGNVISGRASALLSQDGLICDITPPTVIVGKHVKISTLNIQRIKIGFQTDLGPFEISVALHEKRK